jgi:hypothetical protein
MQHFHGLKHFLLAVEHLHIGVLSAFWYWAMQKRRRFSFVAFMWATLPFCLSCTTTSIYPLVCSRWGEENMVRVLFAEK